MSNLIGLVQLAKGLDIGKARHAKDQLGYLGYMEAVVQNLRGGLKH